MSISGPRADAQHMSDLHSPTAQAHRSGHLLHNMVLFGRLLRSSGIDVHPGRMLDLVEAMQYIQIGNRDDFYHAMRSLFVHRREELPVFERAFALFWRRHGPGLATDLGHLLDRPAEMPEVLTIPPMVDEERAGEGEEDGEAVEREDAPVVLEITQTYSAREQLRHKDFGEMSADELQAVRLLMAEMVWNLGQRRTRRLRPGRAQRLDLRRSLRLNLRYGGEILDWSHQAPVTRPRPLVILADISGSMEQYSRLLIQFTYSLATALSQKVESFVFGTRLTRITRQLQHKSLAPAIKEVAQSVEDWSGGTRIGDCLKAFNFEWGRRVLGQGAVVVIISDGWDRGDPALLGAETARLQRHCRRLLWLNPLLGSQRYEPLTRGIVAALPHIDDFLPVHNLKSLEILADHLALLDQRRGRSGTQAGPGREVSSAAFIRRR